MEKLEFGGCYEYHHCRQRKSGSHADAAAVCRRPRHHIDRYRYPSIDEIEEWLWEKRKLRVPREELIQATHASFDNRAGTDEDGEDYTIADRGSLSTVFASRNSAEDTMDNEEIMLKIQNLLDSLDDRSREIIEKTFGIGKYDYEWDDEDIADSLGLTKTRIQQIRRAALAQMKNL